MEDKITSVMREKRMFFPPKQLSRRAYIKSPEEYERMYSESIKNPERFWSAQARENLDWFDRGEKVLEYDFQNIGKVKKPYVKFFSDWKLNVSYNCIDRHINTWKRNKAAIIWQGEKESEKQTLTYQQLHTGETAK